MIQLGWSVLPHYRALFSKKEVADHHNRENCYISQEKDARSHLLHEIEIHLPGMCLQSCVISTTPSVRILCYTAWRWLSQSPGTMLITEIFTYSFKNLKYKLFLYYFPWE